MAKSLTDIAKGAFGGGEEIDRIISLPITGLRLELKDAFRKKTFTEEQYNDFVSRVSALEGEDVAAQVKLAESAIQDRKVASPLDIDFSTPAKQLLWAAALTRIMHLRQELEEGPIVHAEIWKQLQGTIAARDEMIRNGRVVYASLQNDDTSISWGQPGSWFYFNPKANHINLDLYHSLLTGFEHIRSVNLHEIGHSQLSNKYPPKMQELYEKVKNVIDPSTIETEADAEKLKKLTKEEQKEMAGFVKEWNLRFRFWNTLEDICVNQYAANMSQSYPQDFGFSLNHISAVLQGVGEKARGDGQDVEVALAETLNKMPPKRREKLGKKEIEEIKEEIRKSIEASSKPLSDDEIKKIAKGDISPEIAQKMVEQIPWGGLLAFYRHNGMFSKDETFGRLGVFADDIRKTVDVSAVAEAGGKDSFTYLTDLAAGARGINMHQPTSKDKFYGKAHYQQAVSDTNDARNAVMEHIWDVYVEKFAEVLIKKFEEEVEQEIEQQGQQQDGQEGEPGEGQEGQGEPGEGSPGEGSPGQGSPGAGGQSGPKPLSESLKDKIKDMKQSPEDQRKAEQEKAKKDAAGQGQDGKKKDKGPGGWDQDPSADKKQQEQKVGDLRQKEIIDDMTDEQKEAMKKAAEEAGQPGEDALSMDAGHGRGLDLEQLAKGDWKDFNRRALELSPIINSVAQGLRQIREAQKKLVMRQSKNLDYMAEDGDIQGRMDRDKILETKYKQAAKSRLQEDDLKKFQEDTVHINESTIEFHIMIDGSGSMQGWAIAAALQSAAIMYMACRKAGIDCYITMWGDKDPRVIARPDSSLKEVGENMEGARNGINSGTDLAPGLVKSIKELSIHRNRNGTISGSSHILVYSDGDIFDAEESQKDLEIIARHGKNLTVDVAVLKQGGEPGSTKMEQIVAAVVETTHSKMIGLLRGDDPNKTVKDLTNMMLRRVRRIEVKTEPDSAKRKRLKDLYKKLNPGS